MDVKNIEDKRSLSDPVLAPEKSSNAPASKSASIDAVLPSLNKKPLFPVPAPSPEPSSLKKTSVWPSEAAKTPISSQPESLTDQKKSPVSGVPKPFILTPASPDVGAPAPRVMSQDLELLKKGQSPLKTAVPPQNLPVAELKQKTEMPAATAEDYFAARAREEATHKVLKEAVTKVEGIRQQFEKDKMPAPTEKLSALVPEAPSQKKAGHKMIYIILGSIALLLAVVGGLVFWWNYSRVPVSTPTHFECREFQCTIVEGEGTDECKVSADCVSKEPKEPISLIPVKSTEVVNITINQTDNLLVSASQEQLSKFNQGLNVIMNQGDEGELRRVLVKLTNQEKKFAALGEVMMLVNSGKIGVPSGLLKNVKDYTLFIYKPKKEEFDLCKTAGLTDLLCSEPRLGLVMNVSNPEIRSQLLDWETTMVSDLNGLIRAEISAEPYKFNDSSEPNYNGASFIRYVNLAQPAVSVDYGMRDSLLIIGTSRNSVKKVIDALVAAQSLAPVE